MGPGDERRQANLKEHEPNGIKTAITLRGITP